MNGWTVVLRRQPAAEGIAAYGQHVREYHVPPRPVRVMCQLGARIDAPVKDRSDRTEG